MFNEKLSDFRRQLFNLKDELLPKKVLKGTRWLLLTAREHLSSEKDKQQRLEQALELNRPLATAYYMKEDLRQLWNWEGDKNAANWHLTSWIEIAKNSGIEMLKKFANTLERHFDGKLAYFDFGSLSTEEEIGFSFTKPFKIKTQFTFLLCFGQK